MICSYIRSLCSNKQGFYSPPASFLFKCSEDQNSRADWENERNLPSKYCHFMSLDYVLPTNYLILVFQKNHCCQLMKHRHLHLIHPLLDTMYFDNTNIAGQLTGCGVDMNQFLESSFHSFEYWCGLGNLRDFWKMCWHLWLHQPKGMKMTKKGIMQMENGVEADCQEYTPILCSVIFGNICNCFLARLLWEIRVRLKA